MTLNQRIDWPKIFAEGGAIIVSILLAFSIDTWWDNFEESKRGQLYLVGLREDVIQIENELSVQIEFIDRVLGASNEVLAMTKGPDEALLSDEFSTKLGNTYTIRTPNLTTPIYDDMINSGNLRLVTNTELRIKMADLAVLLKKINEQADVINENYWLHHASFIDEHFVVSKFGWFTSSSNSGAFSEQLARMMGKAQEAPFDIDVAAVRTRKFWNLIYDLRTTHGDQLIPLLKAKELSQMLLVLLDKEISVESL